MKFSASELGLDPTQYKNGYVTANGRFIFSFRLRLEECKTKEEVEYWVSVALRKAKGQTGDVVKALARMHMEKNNIT